MKEEPGIAYDKRKTSVVSCDTYSVTVNKVMVATINIRSKDFHLANRNHILNMQVPLECCYI